VRIDVEATHGSQKVTAVTWARFDFTPPSLLEASPDRQVLEADGADAVVDFIFTEELSGPPEVRVAGEALLCEPRTRVEWRCRWSRVLRCRRDGWMPR